MSILVGEIWRDIKGFDGYQVSNYGRVRTFNKVTSNARYATRHWRNRIIKQKVRKDNCHQVNLWKNGQDTTHYVHRLVAEAFLEKPSIKMTVNHKDGNRHNNHVDNLEWLSMADNIRHGFNNKSYSSCQSCSLMSIDGKIYSFRSLTMANMFLCRSHGYISNVIKRHGKITDKNGNEYKIVYLDGDKND